MPQWAVPKLPCGSIFSNNDLFEPHMHAGWLAESWGLGNGGDLRWDKGAKCGRRGSLGNIWRYGAQRTTLGRRGTKIKTARRLNLGSQGLVTVVEGE